MSSRFVRLCVLEKRFVTSGQIEPFGATSNPDRRVVDATENRVADPLRNRGFTPLMNEAG